MEQMFSITGENGGVYLKPDNTLVIHAKTLRGTGVEYVHTIVTVRRMLDLLLASEDSKQVVFDIVDLIRAIEATPRLGFKPLKIVDA